jgi:hypothetical protein
MHYLGGLRGGGVLTCGDQPLARAEYDIDGYFTKPDRVTGSGEIRTSPEVLKEVFGRRDLVLRTDDGRTLTLYFTEKRLAAASDVAHVDVSGDLPARSDWRH